MSSRELLLSVDLSGLSPDAQRFVCVAADWRHFSSCVLLWYAHKLLLTY